MYLDVLDGKTADVLTEQNLLRSESSNALARVSNADAKLH
jgi:hypothetical protein